MSYRSESTYAQPKLLPRHWLTCRGLLALMVLLGNLSAPARTHACSCPFTEQGFLSPPELTLPSNARGLPWWGDLRNEDDLGDGSAIKQAFEVDELIDGEFVSAPFVLKKAERYLAQRALSATSNYMLLAIPLRWMPGAIFRFSYQARDSILRPYLQANETRSQTVIAKVSSQAFIMSPGQALSLSATPSVEGPLEVESDGSCSSIIWAAQSSIEAISEEIERWHDALLIATFVDGLLWKPQSDTCKRIAVGTSWVGKGRELLFAGCGPYGHSSRALSAGAHKVEMVAWIPGTAESVTIQGTVTLACELAKDSAATRSFELGISLGTAESAAFLGWSMSYIAKFLEISREQLERSDGGLGSELEELISLVRSTHPPLSVTSEVAAFRRRAGIFPAVDRPSFDLGFNLGSAESAAQLDPNMKLIDLGYIVKFLEDSRRYLEGMDSILEPELEELISLIRSAPTEILLFSEVRTFRRRVGMYLAADPSRRCDHDGL